MRPPWTRNATVGHGHCRRGPASSLAYSLRSWGRRMESTVLAKTSFNKGFQSQSGTTRMT